MRVFVLVISGSMGSGKTTVLGEISDLLTTAGIAHAAINLDALGIVHAPGVTSDDLAYRNLAAVWHNYAGAGIEKLVIAEAIDTPEKLERIREAVPGANLVVCRLRAPIATMQQRVRVREPVLRQSELVARVVELDAMLDRAHLEDFAIDNGEDHSITDVAREMLARAGWI